jgi:ketosteroid isomerase-like protein
VSPDREAELREAFARAGRGEIDTLVALCCDDVEWTEQLLPDQRVYHGHEGVRQWFRDVLQVFAPGAIDLIGFEESGDRGVTEVVVSATGLESGVSVRTTVFHVIRFRDDRIAEITALSDRDEARRAAGLG